MQVMEIVMQNPITRAAVMLLTIGLLMQTPPLAAQKARPAMTPPATSKPTPAQLDLLYRQATAAFERQDWMEALIKFERLQLLQANYREVNKLADLSRANLLKKAKADGAGMAITGIGVILVVVGVSVLGFVVWFPANRARLHRLFGNYAGAALIYERLVFRKPSRMKLYPPLAQAYLRLNRRDAPAMRIYKRVLELNLPTPLRAELHNLVTGYNLDEMQTRWHVNEVLDSRLERKLSKSLGAFAPPKPLTPENPKSPRRLRKPAKKEALFADSGYAGSPAPDGKFKIVSRVGRDLFETGPPR